MKRVIDGKNYDTETAEVVCELECSVEYGTFGWHDTALYRTKRGRFFLAGRGGARSMWRRQVDSSTWGPGKGIRAIDADEARSHMEAARCAMDTFTRVGLSVEEA